MSLALNGVFAFVTLYSIIFLTTPRFIQTSGALFSSFRFLYLLMFLYFAPNSRRTPTSTVSTNADSISILWIACCTARNDLWYLNDSTLRITSLFSVGNNTGLDR